MSLKAKIEAVIYAAEEPVTLAQLAALFESEAAESLAASRSQLPTLDAPPPAEQTLSLPENETGGILPAPEVATEAPEESPLSGESEPPNPSAASIASEPPIADAPDSAAPDSNSAPGSEAPPAIDEKKAARQREREIRDELKRLITELIDEYSSTDRGMEIREVAGGYRVATKPEYHDAVRSFVKSLKPPMKLSLQALETLAVIAYKQPVTAPEVSEIRGVDSGGVLGGLISRKLITTAGRKQVIGRPILYKTTKEFLLRFGLKDLGELPSIEEFEKMAGEIEIAEESESTQPAASREDDLPFSEDSEPAEGLTEPPPENTRPDTESSLDANAGEAGIAVTAAEPEAAQAMEPEASEAASQPVVEAVPLDAPAPGEDAPAQAEDVELVTSAQPPVEGE